MHCDHIVRGIPPEDGMLSQIHVSIMPSLRSISPTMSGVSSGGVRGLILLRSAPVLLRSAPVGMAGMCSGGATVSPICCAGLAGLQSGSRRSHVGGHGCRSSHVCKVCGPSSMRLA